MLSNGFFVNQKWVTSFANLVHSGPSTFLLVVLVFHHQPGQSSGLSLCVSSFIFWFFCGVKNRKQQLFQNLFPPFSGLFLFLNFLYLPKINIYKSKNTKQKTKYKKKKPIWNQKTLKYKLNIFCYFNTSPNKHFVLF